MILRREVNIDVPVVTTGTPIAFDTPWTGLDYAVFINCYDSFGDVACDITNKTANGFTATPVANATLEWEAVQVGTTETSSGRLSRDWTAQMLWTEALRDLNADFSSVFNFERFNMIDRAIQNVAGQFYSVFGGRYVRETTRSVDASDRVTVSNIRIMHSGQELRLKLWMTVSGRKIRFVPGAYEDLLSFRVSPQNRYKVMYAHLGDLIELAKGSSIGTWGTVTVLYPSVPIKALTDTTYLDLPDGIPMELARLALKAHVVERFQLQKKDFAQEAQGLLAGLYSQFGVTMKLTEKEQQSKVRAIIGG